MPHIDLPDHLPGITALFAVRPDTAEPLQTLAETLLRGPGGLTRGERELIAAYVSHLNACRFCCDSHTAFAGAQLPGGSTLVREILRDPGSAPVGDKLRALLRIAEKVQVGGRHVLPEDVDAARAAGATDDDIHDTVLIAAAFCMFNRYVDGLATRRPEAPEAYDEMAERIVEHGYLAGSGASALST